MRTNRILSCLLAATTLLAAASSRATSLTDLTFQRAKGTPAMLQALTPADRQVIVSLLPIALDRQGKIIDNDRNCGQNAGPELSVVDLRGNGQPAVLAITGNTCTSGMTGASLVMVAKVGQQWRRMFDVPAIEYRVLRSQTNGWPEIGLLGRSECIGVWQFDGRGDYVFSRNIDERGAPCR